MNVDDCWALPPALLSNIKISPSRLDNSHVNMEIISRTCDNDKSYHKQYNDKITCITCTCRCCIQCVCWSYFMRKHNIHGVMIESKSSTFSMKCVYSYGLHANTQRAWPDVVLLTKCNFKRNETHSNVSRNSNNSSNTANEQNLQINVAYLIYRLLQIVCYFEHTKQK